ncbi:hypothetical protein [Limisalsivibrio acetivorans]|uniref:hypothetical protein n=1 Tax=Limisalsivibrio acetivorans TaxID=1304888 RepID=UPI0003B38E4F|nr:hypothetical protein [Limisalsivibrio acetivorans]
MNINSVTAGEATKLFGSRNKGVNDEFSRALDKRLDEIRSTQERIKSKHGSFHKPITMPNSGGKAITLESIADRTKLLESVFKETLGDILKDRGIDTSTPFELRTGRNGGVTVTGEHPQKDQINKIFEDYPDLENLFRGISSNHHLMAAAEASEQFRNDYAVNPVSAVMKHSYLFDGSLKIDVWLRITEDGFTWDTETEGTNEAKDTKAV